MFQLEKEFAFSASHVLSHLSADHPCARLHGHNWRLRFVLMGVLDEATHFVRDYRDLDPVKRWVDDQLDHRHLNDLPGLAIPTSEEIARYAFTLWLHEFPELVAVRVSETDKTWATYWPEIFPTYQGARHTIP